MDKNPSSQRLEAEQLESHYVFTVDSFSSGIAFGQHRLPAHKDPREVYALRLRDNSQVVKLRSRYVLHKHNPLHELERHLMRLSQQGILRRSSIYFGTTSDPFYPFEGKFDASIKFLELFQKYTPGMLYVQTRSPLLVIALPVFKKLGKHCAITVGLETCLEESVDRDTPGLPRVEERLKTIRALRRFNVEVNLQISPILPYGDWREDAGSFAKILCENSDHIYLSGIVDSHDGNSKRAHNSVLARKLAEDRRFHWLRPDTAQPLYEAIQQIAPEKLNLPERAHLGKKQVEMFAA